MDAFYASVEQRDDPSLKGKPVAVGGSPDGRGVVAASSYEARVFGVKSAMPMARAIRQCPQLVIVSPDFTKYSDASKQIFEIFREVTPLVEGLSLDEAYLDVTENSLGLTLGVDVARWIKQRIQDVTKLTASAGVAPNKFLAKIASGWKKPDGLTVIAPERVDSFLQGLPVEALWGVGPVTAKRLKELGIHKLVDVRNAPAELLKQAVGSWAEGLREMSFGVDDREVESEWEPKSSGSEETFAKDLTDRTEMLSYLDRMARDGGEWLERHGLFARTVTIKVRYSNFDTITRSDTKKPATRSADEIAGRAKAMLDRTEAGARPVRLLGVSVHGLVAEPWGSEGPERQLRLPFADG